MNKKKTNKLLIVLLAIGLCLAAVGATKLTKVFMNTFGKKEVASNYEEKELSSVVNDMYITILDDKANVVATTNPDTEVSPDYAFTDTTEPVKKVKFNGKYIVLLEVNDTNSLENKTLLEDNVVYTMTLPDYMISYEGFDSDIEENCYNFFSDNAVTACGGVYDDNVLKMIFNNTKDKYDITFNYQFFITFAAGLKDTDFDIKTFDFGKYGSLQLYFEEAYPVIPPSYHDGTNYNFTITNNGYTSTTNNYLKWEVNLSDTRDTNKHYNGTLNISLSSNMGIVVDKRNAYENMDIYVDGVALSKKYTDGYNGCFYNATNDCLISIEAEEDASVFANSGTKQGGLLNGFIVTLDSSLAGVENIKIEFNAKAYNIYNAANTSANFIVQGDYYDNEEQYDVYHKEPLKVVYYQNPSTNFTVAGNMGTALENELPDSLKYTFTYYASYKNYATFEVDPYYSNSMGAYYYLNSKGFTASETDTSKSFTIKIDNQDVEFERVENINLSSLANDQLTKVDPALQKQMTVIDSYNDNKSGNLHNILRSTTTNADGDYYWLVISKDTLNIANNNSDNTNIYDNSASGNELGTPAKWKIYVFNVSNSRIDLEWEQYLEKIVYYHTSSSSRELDSRVYVNNGSYKYSYYYNHLSNPIIIHHEQLNEFVKWDVVLDTKLIKNGSSSLSNFNMKLYLPYEQRIINGYYYDVETNKIVSDYDDTREQYATNKVVMCDQETNNKIDECAHYVQFGDTDSTFTAGAGSPSFSFNYYSNTYNYDNSNVQIDSDGLVHLVFFTYSDYSDMGSQGYGLNSAYIQLIMETPTNKYSDDTGFEAHDKLRYKLATSTGFLYTYYEMYESYDNGSGSNGSSFEERDRYFNGLVNLYNDFGGYIWGYDDDYYSTSNCGNDLTSIRNCNNKILFNGTYRTFIGYDWDPIPSTMTSMKVVIDEDFATAKTIDLGTLTFNEGLYEHCDTSSGICINIEDINKDGMTSGYFVDVSGLENTKTLKLTYNEYVDTYTLLTNNYGATTYYSYLYAEPFRWGDYYDYNYTSIERSIYAAADIAVESSGVISTLNGVDGLAASMNDTVRTYKSNTDYINVEGYLNTARNVTLTNDYSTSIEVADLKQYLTVHDMIIYAVDNNGNHVDIYANGTFYSDYSNSTLSLLGTGNNLYTLHLVKNSGELEPMEIFIDYYLVLSLDVRSADFYEGKKIGIYTNTKASKEFACPTCTVSEDDGNGNGYDATLQELYAHAYAYQSNRLTYFSGGKVNKSSGLESDGAKYYNVSYTAGDAGKNGPADMELVDTVKVSDNYGYSSNAFVQMRALYVKHSHYANVVLHYGDDNVELPLESGTFIVRDLTGTITYDTDALKFTVNMPIEDYKDTISVTYSIETDYASLYAEAIENGWLNSQGKILGYQQSWNSVYQYYIYNTVKDDNTNESSSSSGGSYIKITDVAPMIAKNYSVINREERNWQVVFNTGKDATEIRIQDGMSIEEDGKEEFYNALRNKDLLIKVGSTTIYQNGTFTSGWEGTVEITNNGLNQNFVFKDTDTKEWLKNNSTVIISYNTYLDYSLLSGDTRVVDFHLKNSVDLTKGINKDSAIATTYFNYEYTHNVSKVYLGNSDDITETNWKINVSSDKKRITNINLTDTNTLGDEFGDYLSISKFRIVSVNLTNNSTTVLYDTENDINDLDGITLGMVGDSVPGLKLNTNGKYDFFVNIAELPADTRIEVYYSLKVDKGAYISSGSMLDKELVINNKVQDNNNKQSTATGSTKVPSELTKRYVSLGKDSEGYEVIRWTIDVNLADYYELSNLVGKDVTITDEINDVFGLDPASVTIRGLQVKPNGNVVGALVNTDYYELEAGDNRVQIKLLNPLETPAIQISFTTRVVGSIHNVYNSVELEVDNHKTGVTVEDEVTIFSPAVFGVVYSRDMLSYTIYARKLVDDTVSDKTFMFKITEIDSNGEVVDGGYTATSTNGAEGRIEFNGLRYSRVGTYYYKVEEVIDENDKELVYDKNVYTVKVVVVGNADNTSYVVESAEIVGGADEIVFNNKTPQTESSEEPKNPNTKVFIGSIIAILLVISFYLFSKFYKKTNFLK